MNQRPTTNNQQPTTNNQRPTTNDQRPTTNDQRRIRFYIFCFLVTNKQSSVKSRVNPWIKKTSSGLPVVRKSRFSREINLRKSVKSAESVCNHANAIHDQAGKLADCDNRRACWRWRCWWYIRKVRHSPMLKRSRGLTGELMRLRLRSSASALRSRSLRSFCFSIKAAITAGELV